MHKKNQALHWGNATRIDAIHTDTHKDAASLHGHNG